LEEELLPPPRVSPTIGLGRIGCGGGLGTGLFAMFLILGLVDQDDYPRNDLSDRQDRSDPEGSHEPARLVSIEPGAIAHVQGEVAVDARKL
jgi:hypothetical protein